MNSRLLRLICFCILHSAFCLSANAQWQTTTYTLKGGWNAIYLHGEATHASMLELFPNSGAAANVLEVWRWNPNPNQVQFTESPLIPSPGTPEWSVWVRNGTANTLAQMTGQTGYLVKCSGTAATTYTLTIPQRPLPPSAVWRRSGANLIGFPARLNGTYPPFSGYFATFPVAFSANAKVFKYVGGDLGPVNPLQIFSPPNEPVDRNKAYWFSADVVGDFYAPLEVSLSNSEGLDFGRSESRITARLRNRTAATVTVTMTPASSDAVPVVPPGLPSISGVVPLTRRTFNVSTGLWTETPVAPQSTVEIGPQSTVEVNFGLDRALLTGGNNAFYASLLHLTDSANLLDIVIPARASVGSLSGLWIGEASVTNVVSKVATSPGSTTARPYPLRLILHVDDGGTARLLSQVFMGTLNSEGNPQGLCTRESGLKQDRKASAVRFSVAHMPLDRAIDNSSPGTNTGTVTQGSSLVRTISIDYREGTNPFVHQYHPDHDNKDARPDGTSTPKGDGEESFTVTRTCTFQFTTTPLPGSTATGWGSRVIGGNYSETLAGLHKEAIQVSGTFELRRVSEIGTITTN